jgi:hypothetical protein
MPVVNFNVALDTDKDYTPEQLREFLSRVLRTGKDFAAGDDHAPAGLAEMLESVLVAEPIEAAKPRVLITLSGGLADWVADETADVVKFDFDAEEDEEWDYCEPVPVHFEDLARRVNVPVEGDKWPPHDVDATPKMGL